uniref:Uncharacterized protein n=1 Tax=Ascaris lumbricoides TaxID=6252 RepID=A0A0M3I1H3_ASCLU
MESSRVRALSLFVEPLPPFSGCKRPGCGAVLGVAWVMSSSVIPEVFWRCANLFHVWRAFGLSPRCFGGFQELVRHVLLSARS